MDPTACTQWLEECPQPCDAVMCSGDLAERCIQGLGLGTVRLTVRHTDLLRQMTESCGKELGMGGVKSGAGGGAQGPPL